MINYPLNMKVLLIALWGLFSFTVPAFLSDDRDVQNGLSLLILFAGLWMTEIFPLAVTALFVPVMAFLLHIFTAKEAMAPFSSTIIYLFMGGFTLAALLNKYGIDKWLAGGMVKLTQGHLWLSVIGFFLVTSFLSMWMSNTSTTAMMLPIAMGLVGKEFPRMRTYIILGTAYCANVGGLATVVGSPPNGIAAAALDLDFVSWLKVGLPSTIILFPVVVSALWWGLKPEANAQLQSFKLDEKMIWSPQAKGAVLLFAFTVIGWIFSKQIGQWLDLTKVDRMVAIAITAFAPALGLIKWKELESKIDWGILLLFGAGLCLSAVLAATGTSEWLAGEVLSFFADSADWVLILSCIGLMIFLTELASNTGSAAILIPVMYAMANQFNPAITYTLVFGVGVAATCAFMLPVATPPNALAYGTGEVSQKYMLKVGFIINVIAIFAVYLCVVTFS